MATAPRPIFLSYASQDAEAARRVAGALSKAGLEVWFDQSELKGGDSWDASIRRKIRECALFVPVISATTNERSEGYFRLEWKLAVDRSHLMADDQAFLLPVVIDGTAEASARVPDAFRERQWSRLADESALASFAARVSAILTGSDDPGAPQAPPRAAPAASPDAGDTPSIAVLAFANRSNDPNDEYFADGLADELLNLLARIRGLRVAARTSSFQFKGKALDVSVIGRKLNVATVLEGSVRKSGNRVRISVQLVKVADGYQLWSDTYDRTLEDIFAVQDDIARAVVQGLREALLETGPGAKTIGQVSAEVAMAASGRSANAEAYRLYLQGRYLVNRMSAADITRGIECLQAAIHQDPHFAQAHATLSWAHTYAGGFGLAAPQEANAHARAAAQRSLALKPDLVEGLVALGTIQMWHDWDWPGAEASLGRALELEPGKPEAARDYGLLMWILGRYGEAVTHGRRAIEQDPLDATSHLYLCGSLFSLHLLEEAETICRKGLELSPDGFALRYWLAMILDAQGRREEALAETRRDKTDWSRLTCLAAIHFHLGQFEESSAALAELEATSPDLSAFQIAQAHAARGEADEAFAWLERAYDQRDAGISMTRSCPWFDPVKDDPRWEPFLRKTGLAD